MDNNLNMIGQDRLDALLFDIADEADDGVDYAAMLDTVYKKAAARKNHPKSTDNACRSADAGGCGDGTGTA